MLKSQIPFLFCDAKQGLSAPLCISPEKLYLISSGGGEMSYPVPLNKIGSPGVGLKVESGWSRVQWVFFLAMGDKPTLFCRKQSWGQG